MASSTQQTEFLSKKSKADFEIKVLGKIRENKFIDCLCWAESEIRTFIKICNL